MGHLQHRRGKSYRLWLFFSWGNTEGYIHNGSKWVLASDSKTPLGSDGSFSETNYASTSGSKLKTNISPTSVTDAARVNWGGDWRMPTNDEFKAMKDATYWAWDDDDEGYYVYIPVSGDEGGHNGKKSDTETDITGSYNKDNALLFFPTTGYGDTTSLDYEGSEGNYWSSTFHGYVESYAYCPSFDSSAFYPTAHSDRYFGYPIRPVSD